MMTGKLGDAMAIMNNPPGAAYSAMFDGGDGSSVKGKVAAMSGPGGKGVMFDLNIMGLPMSGGPFSYHLHDQPVPMDGNCNGTLAHLDPYQRVQAVACDMMNPQTCEVGDLSGKHGKLDGPSSMKSFVDMYATLVAGIGAFFGNRSIVFHSASSARIACANFTMMPPMMPQT
ncbi:superoxide dismutase [Schizothecium vesticola]|uniref:superoxide dismutase n=1 Tax=Schizothecium vesticola TaxID=314040 RepID=A0AA40BPQ5_9PEZI|nr:superoxide dismutase [Schizothecium vesticola]